MGGSRTRSTSSTDDPAANSSRKLPKIPGIPIVIVKRTVYSVVFLLASAFLAAQFDVFPAPPSSDVSSRIVYAARGLVFSMLPMAFLVTRIATMRAASPRDLGDDPVRQETYYEFDVYTRALQNTVEQTIVHIVTVIALATLLPRDKFYFLPLCIFWFVVGRFAFLIGYLDLRIPGRRVYGFLITSLPTFAGVCYSLYQIVFVVGMSAELAV